MLKIKSKILALRYRMVGLAKLFPRCRKTRNKKRRNFKYLRNASPWDSLGLAYNEKKREKWIFVIPTWEVFA
jgi:hypothetical protein